MARRIQRESRRTYLHAVDGQAGSGVQLLVTDVTFEMFGLLVLDEDLLVIKVSVTIPGGELRRNTAQRDLPTYQSTDCRGTNQWTPPPQQTNPWKVTPPKNIQKPPNKEHQFIPKIRSGNS